MAQDPIEGASNKTQELVSRYQFALDALAAAEREVNHKKTDLNNAVNLLGAHLCPEDAQAGESFSIWVRTKDGSEKLLIVTYKDGFDHYEFAWRKKGRK